MLGKTKTGRGFKGTIEYCLQEKKDPEILYSNNIVNSEKREIIKEFVSVSGTHDTVSKPVWHSSLAFSNMDKVSDLLMTEIANRFMEKAGFNKENHQWIIIKHNDTHHAHVHIVASRIGLDDQVVSDFYFKSRTVQWAKELEKEYGLTEVQKIAHENRILNSFENEKKQMKETITNVLNGKGVKTFEDFQASLKKQGIDVVVSRHKKTGQAYGVSFTIGQKTYKGSDIGKKLAFKALNQLLPIPGPVLSVLKLSTQMITKGIGQSL